MSTFSFQFTNSQQLTLNTFVDKSDIINFYRLSDLSTPLFSWCHNLHKPKQIVGTSVKGAKKNYLLPKPGTNCYVCLIDGTAGMFSYLLRRDQELNSRQFSWTLIKDALPTELQKAATV